MKTIRKGLGIVLMTLLLVICFNTNSKAAGDNMSTAIPINLNETFYGNIGYNMDTIRKYYKFTLPQNSIVKLYIKTGASEQHVDVELRDSTGEGLGAGNGSGEYLETDDDKNWGFQSAEDRVALNAGTYYLRLLSTDDTNYEMKVSVETKASNKIEIAGFQNYNRSMALPISIGNKIVGIAEWDYNYEYKYFKFYEEEQNKMQEMIEQEQQELQRQSYTDLSYTHYEFKKFIQRVESHYDDFRYIATFNRQSSGNWHYHLFCNFPPNIPNKTITHLWQRGITYITYIKTQADYQQCMDYLIQNMDQAANELKGKRGYLAPKDIERDKVINSWKQVD